MRWLSVLFIAATLSAQVVTVPSGSPAGVINNNFQWLKRNTVQKDASGNAKIGSTVLASPVCNGTTDDTAAIQAPLAAGAGTVMVSNPGVCIISAPITLTSGQTLRLSGATTIKLKASSNCVMLKNANAGAAGNTDITVEGGTWDQNGANQATQGDYPLWWGESSLFVKTTRLRIRNTNWLNGLKYALFLSDATDFSVENTTCTTGSDCVHINAPATYGVVRNTRYTVAFAPGDDAVSIGIGDYAPYVVTVGDVSDVLVDGVYGGSKTNAVKLYRIGNTSNIMKHVAVRNVRNVYAGSYGIELGSDDGSTRFLEDVEISDAEVNRIHVDTTTWIGRLVIRNLKTAIDGPAYYQDVSTSTVDDLLIDGVSTKGQTYANGLLDIRGTVNKLTVNNLSLTSPTKQAGCYAFSGTSTAVIGKMTGNNWTVEHCTNTLHYGGNLTASLSNFAIEDVTIGLLNSNGGTASTINLNLSNVSVKTASDLMELYGPSNIIINGLQIEAVPWLVVTNNAAATGSVNINQFRYAATGWGLRYVNSGSVGVSIAPQWYKYTKTYSDFSTASTSNYSLLFQLPNNGCISGSKIKPTTAFTGGSISAYTVSVGVNGDTARYGTAFDAFTAVAAYGRMGVSSAANCENGSGNANGTNDIRAYAASTGANLSAATAGSVDIFVLVSFTN